MTMGQQKDRQGDLMVGWAEMPRSPGHVFYDRLRSVLIEGGFDGFAEAACRSYYAARLGAPSVPPGRYFRMHLVGYFEGIDSERGLEWRCSDSLSLREFLRLESRDRVPDHSWLSRTRARLPHEVHTAIFDWVLALIAEAGLVKGERIGVDASTMEANAALRNIVRRDTGEGYRGMLARLAQESGIETPTAEDLARLDRKRKGKKLSNQDWVSKSDPAAKIAKMKDGTTHLAYKPEHAVDLDTGAVVAAELHPADEGGHDDAGEDAGGGQGESRGGGRGTDGRRPGRMRDRQGLSLTVGLKGARRRPLEDADLRAQAERFCALARRRGGPPGSHQQPDPAVIGRGQGSLQAARRDRRALLCAQPRSRRHAPDMAARARERAQAIPAPCRRPQSESPDAQTDRRRHPAGGRGGRIWLYLRAYCASWSRSARSDGPHRLGGWRNRLRRDMFRRRVKPGQ